MLTLRLAPPGANRPDRPSLVHREVDAWLDGDGRQLARAYTDGRAPWVHWPGVATFHLEDPHTVIVWPDAGASAETVTDTFLRAVQPVLLQSLGFETLHGSAAMADDGVVVLCGRSGSGKSTLAYAAGMRGWRQVADDNVVFTIDDGAAVACLLPFSPRLRPASREYLHADDSTVGATRAGERVPIARLCLLRQDPAHASPTPDVRRIGPPQAFAQVLAHAHVFDRSNPADSERLVHHYLALVERTPVFAVTYRPGLDALPDLVDALMK